MAHHIVCLSVFDLCDDIFFIVRGVKAARLFKMFVLFLIPWQHPTLYWTICVSVLV